MLECSLADQIVQSIWTNSKLIWAGYLAGYCVQSGVEHYQRWRLNNVSGKPVPESV